MDKKSSENSGKRDQKQRFLFESSENIKLDK